MGTPATPCTLARFQEPAGEGGGNVPVAVAAKSVIELKRLWFKRNKFIVLFIFTKRNYQTSYQTTTSKYKLMFKIPRLSKIKSSNWRSLMKILLSCFNFKRLHWSTSRTWFCRSKAVSVSVEKCESYTMWIYFPTISFNLRKRWY